LQKSNVILYLINAAIFILLEVAALNMLHNNGPLQSTWLSKGSQAVMGTVWGGAQNVKHYFSLKKSNDSLALENHDLRLRIAQFEAMLEGTQEVQAPMAADAKGKAGNFVYTPATIVKISNNSRHNYIIIGKGSNDGITKGSGVITGKGAIGVIDAVSSNYSYARSFKNHEMSISARLGKEGAIGPMNWDGRSSAGAILKEIPHHVDFQPGDTVYTSGFSSIFPPDIPLGTVGEAKIVNGATYDIKVTLFEDYGALRYVTIVDNLGKEEIKALEKGNHENR
jgi:rod shape-determining protein MreC